MSLTRSQISGDGFGSLPVVEEVVGPGLDGLVLRHDLHLEAGDLSLDRRILPANDLVEGTPLALDKNDFEINLFLERQLAQFPIVISN